jgi:hypothetical protein
MGIHRWLNASREPILWERSGNCKSFLAGFDDSEAHAMRGNPLVRAREMW